MANNSRIFAPLIGSEFIQWALDRGYVPAGTTRIIIDSGYPGEVVKIFWCGFAERDMVEGLMNGIVPEPQDDDLEKLKGIVDQ